MTGPAARASDPEGPWWSYLLGGIVAAALGVRIGLDADAGSSIAEWGLAVIFVVLGLLMAGIGLMLRRR